MTTSLLFFLTVLCIRVVSVCRYQKDELLDRAKHNFLLSVSTISTCTFLTFPSSLLKALITRPRGHSLRYSPSFINTMSPSARFLCCWFHFFLGWRDWRYSRRHLSQNCSARYWTRLHRRWAYRSVGKKLPGGGPKWRAFIVINNGWGSSTSVGIAVNGRALTIPVTSAINGDKSSWVSWALPSSTNMPSRTRRMVPICLSHTPPKWDACGGLNFHSHP